MEIMRSVTPPQYLQDLICGGATYAPVAGIARGLVDEVVDPGPARPRDRRRASLGGAFAGRLCLDQAADPPAGAGACPRWGHLIDAEVAKIWAAQETLDRVRDYVSRTFKKAWTVSSA